MVRLIDIAKKTGFSVAVVSRALQQEKDPYDRISEKSRSLIRKAALEMGYTRNLQAAFLRRGQMPAVRVLMPAWTSPEIIQMSMGISDASLKLGYPLIYHYYSRETDYISFLEQSRHEKNTGVIFYLTEFLDSTPYRACIQSNSFFRIKGIMLGPVPASINKFIFPYRGTHVRIRIATSIFQLLGIDNSNSSQKLYPIFVGIVSVITGAVHRQGIIIVGIPVKENCGSGCF